MVNDHAQLFTIEGIAAALIMLITVYIVVNTTSVYTAGDTHINDMQLEVIGSDALRMINTPVTGSEKSPLVQAVENNDGNLFFTRFNETLNSRAFNRSDFIQFRANISYVQQNQVVNNVFLNMSRELYGGEHAVHVSQWIVIENRQLAGWGNPYYRGKHAALVEVLLWRD